MQYRDDKIKILELICAQMLPFEVFQNAEETQDISLDENDFKKEGFSFNSALLILKDIFSASFIHKFNIETTKEGLSRVKLSVSPDIEFYTKRLKYPETEHEEYEDFLDSRSVTASKISIVIDDKKGIYKEDNAELCYQIKNPSKRMMIISILCHKDKALISELERETGQSNTLTIKEIREINFNFRKKLNLAYDFIIRVPTSGYSLNKDKFDIKTLS